MSVFIDEIKKRASKDVKTIILPESEDIRVLEATKQVIEEGYAKIILVGNEEKILKKAKENNINISEAKIVDPNNAKEYDEFVEILYNLRKHKGMTEEQAKELVKDPVYFGMLMLKDEKSEADGLVSGKAEIETIPSDDSFLSDGEHLPFTGGEEDHVVVKPSSWQKRILEKPRLKIQSVRVDSSLREYPASNIIDNDDTTWWIANDDKCPQVITLVLDRVTYVSASRILFQKDSSSYKHKVETSKDGERWEVLYERECTGWEFKPMTVDREIKYFRVTISGVSEGRAGLGEISLY